MKKFVAITALIGLPCSAVAAFQYDYSNVDLSLPARIERGKAVPPPKNFADSPAMRSWMKYGCLWNSPDAKTAGDDVGACLHQIAAELPPFDPSKPRYFGEHYSPQRFLECKAYAHAVRGQGQFSATQCEVFRLRRIENPYFWPYPHNQDFKWLEAPKESVYRPGMTPEAYHKALCEKESGRWIYRKTERVKSYYQIRPHHPETARDDRKDMFVSENPVEFVLIWAMFSQKRPRGGGTTKIGGEIVRGYEFIETPVREIFGEVTGPYMRHEVNFVPTTQGFNDVAFSKPVAKIESQYGFVWRGIERENDREMGIAGVEWGVVDLKSNQILSLMRTFLRGGGRGAAFSRGMQACQLPATDTNPYNLLTETLIPNSSN